MKSKKKTKRKTRNTKKHKQNKMIVHQVFGLMGDTKLPPLFKKSQEAFKLFCKKNNYRYKFWNKNACEKLIEEYKDYKDMYYSVRYTIMKVDIIRFLILHKHGGLYVDLDIIPKIKKLVNSDLVIAYKVADKRQHYEMEVVQSKKGNPFLLNFLDHVKQQIKDKNKIKIYEIWKARYIYQTTGPYSLHRFLNENNIKPDKYIINEPKSNDKSLNLTGKEDFISYPSCSYLCKL